MEGGRDRDSEHEKRDQEDQKRERKVGKGGEGYKRRGRVGDAEIEEGERRQGRERRSGERLRREARRDADSDTEPDKPREAPTGTRARGPTHHLARAAPAERPLRAGTALPAHPGRTGQVPSGGAIPASACKGRREANGGAGRSFKGNAATRTPRRNPGAGGGRTALDSQCRTMILLADLGWAEEPLGLSFTLCKMEEGGLTESSI